MTEHTRGEQALVALLNQIEDGFGDSLRMLGHRVEGGRIYPANSEAGLAEMILGYQLNPDCELDEFGYPDADEQGFSSLVVRLELRERGEEEGIQVSVSLPRDWRFPLSAEDESSLVNWFEEAGPTVGVMVRAA